MNLQILFPIQFLLNTPDINKFNISSSNSRNFTKPVFEKSLEKMSDISYGRENDVINIEISGERRRKWKPKHIKQERQIAEEIKKRIPNTLP